MEDKREKTSLIGLGTTIWQVGNRIREAAKPLRLTHLPMLARPAGSLRVVTMMPDSTNPRQYPGQIDFSG